ncbi:MAG: hypothetical protein DCC65_02525 [Planctomycetota bacterium]|nr:MAG: hypothetical protein DCC65_02525 [Planctomycetota bacterium]
MVRKESDTIAALLTPPAPGAIAVIGVAGPDIGTILSAVLRHARRDEPALLTPDRPRLCRILIGREFIDDAIVTLCGEASSSAEICTHGGIRIAQRVLAGLEAHGARVVGSEAYVAATAPDGKIERDVDRALVASQSVRLTRWLLAQRRILPEYLARWNSDSAEARAAFRARSEVAIRLVRGIHIAIVGPPNAGKSTLANRLIGHERAVTSDAPGTTRDWVSETALIRGWPVTLTDTAGIRETDCAIEAEAIVRGQVRAAEADLVISLTDACRPRLPEEAERQRARPVSARRVVEVFSKCDLAAAGSANVPKGAIRLSAVTGEGIDVLERRIEMELCLDLLAEEAPTAFLPHHLD